MRVVSPGLPRGKQWAEPERLDVGSPTPNKGIRRAPPLPAFSPQEKGKSLALKTPIEKTKKKGPQKSRGRREGKRLRQVKRPGAGLTGGRSPLSQTESKISGTPRGGWPPGGGAARGGAIAALATHRLVRSPPHDGTNPHSIPRLRQG